MNVRNAHIPRRSAVAMAVLAIVCPRFVLALPVGAQVAAGDVSVSTPSATNMHIDQRTGRAIVNWQSFSIAGNEAVAIRQPGADSVLLNRVQGNNASTIAGQLSANGKVFLVNPAGVLFAPGASVSVGSLVASTLEIRDADFLAGTYRFAGTSLASVHNGGTITAAQGGTVALLGGQVSNDGTITARMGTVALAAGSGVTLDFAGDGLTRVRIDEAAAQALLANAGQLVADGGQVVLSARAANALADSVLNQNGIVRARSIAERGGRIVLDGGETGVTMVGGTLDATGAAGLRGGQIDVTGHNVALLADATADASGAAGGGVLRVGGGARGEDPTLRNANAVWLAPGATLLADATASGNGGNVVVYATDAARVYGKLSARGGPGGGDGGLIETSGQYLDVNRASIDASAPAGRGGTWLIDPAEITINDTTDSDPSVVVDKDPTFGSNGSSTIVKVYQLEYSLNQGYSVTVETTGTPASTVDGNIVVASSITKSAGTASTLTLNARNGIIVNDGVEIASTSGKLNLDFNANYLGTPGSLAGIRLGGVVSGSTAPVKLTTKGGYVKLGGLANQNGAFSATGQYAVGGVGPNGEAISGIALTRVSIDTRASDGSGGDVSMFGVARAGRPATAGDVAGVVLNQTTINTGTGGVTLNGNNLGNGNGVLLNLTTMSTTQGGMNIVGAGNGNGPATYLQTSTLNTQTGDIHLIGTNNASSSSVNSGVWLTGSTLGTGGGRIILDGASQIASGVFVASSTLTTTGTGDLIIRGSSEDGGPAVTIGSGATISTQAGDISINGASTSQDQVGFGYSGVQIGQATISTVDGDISISGSTLAFAPGTLVAGSNISASGRGSIRIVGVNTLPSSDGPAPPGGAGLIISAALVGESNPTLFPTTISSNSGGISLYGQGNNFSESSTGYGTYIGSNVSITSGSGAIDIRGYIDAFSDTSALSYGVQTDTATITSRTGAITISGETAGDNAGLHMVGTTVGNASSQGDVTLRALNDGLSSNSIELSGTTFTSTGTLFVRPGGVSVDGDGNFTLTAANAVPITLFGSSGTFGMALDQATLAQFGTRFSSWVLGSDTHTGRINVGSVCASGTGCVMPTFSPPSSLTLVNRGTGSEGIGLYGNLRMLGKTLTLASVGPVDTAGSIQANALLLAGSAAFNLTNPANHVGVLSAANAGNVNYVDSGALTIGGVTAVSVDGNTDHTTTIDGSTTTVAGNLNVQLLSGGLQLGGTTRQVAATGPTGSPDGSIVAGGNVDLVMPNGVFTNAGNGTIGAGGTWRVWALTWVGETRGNANPGNPQPNLYGCTYAGGCSWGGIVPATGNRFVYVQRPVLIVAADSKGRLVGADNPPLTYSVNGLANGDTLADVLSGALFTRATARSPQGLYAIDGNFAAGLGYLLEFQPATLQVVGSPALDGLQSFFGPREKTFVYENNLRQLDLCLAPTQPITGNQTADPRADLLAIEWRRVRSQPNLNSCVFINSQNQCGDF